MADYEVLKSDQYKNYVFRQAGGDYDEAEKYLSECIDLSKAGGSAGELSFLYQDMAELQADAKRYSKAVEYSELAVSVDPESCQVKLRRARLHLEKLEDPGNALSILDNFIEDLQGRPEVCSSEGLNPEYFLGRAYIFHAMCNLRLQDMTALEKDLDALEAYNLALGDNHGHAVELCRLLLQESRLVEQAKKCLEKVLIDVGALKDRKYKAAFVSRIKKLLAGAG